MRRFVVRDAGGMRRQRECEGEGERERGEGRGERERERECGRGWEGEMKEVHEGRSAGRDKYEGEEKEEQSKGKEEDREEGTSLR